MNLNDIAILIIKLSAKYPSDQKKWNIIKYKNLLLYIKMDNGILMFGDIKIEKYKFYIDIEKVSVSNKISSGEKTVNTLLVTCIMIIKLIHYI